MKSKAITTIWGLSTLTIVLFFLGCEGNGSFIDSEKGHSEASGETLVLSYEDGNEEGEVIQPDPEMEENEESDLDDNGTRPRVACVDCTGQQTVDILKVEDTHGRTWLNYADDGRNYITHGSDSGEFTRFRRYTGVGYVHIMEITNDGKVGIGTSEPSHELSVHGTIQAEEVIVEQFTPDYVFGESYDLWSPEEIEAYIEAEQHLPGVPSADDIAAHGVSLGDQQAVLLQKVEELTLHMIEQNKRLKRQEKTISELQAKVSKSTEKN